MKNKPNGELLAAVNKKKKFNSNRKNAHLFYPINSNREEKFNLKESDEICKGKSPSNDIIQEIQSQQTTEKSNANTRKANLFCQKSLPPLRICNGKNVSTFEEQMDIDQEAMAIHFEEEILMDILSRLPVRSLLRFKCVSKFWKTLISDPYFKMKHLSHAKNDQNSQKFLITQCCPKDDIFSMYCCPLSLVQPVEDVKELDFPSSSKPWHCAIHCCCDGLVILQVTSKNCDNRSFLVLWNPSTRESIVLPDPELPSEVSSCLGFGYDSTRGEYKILIIHNGDAARKSPGEVLALKSCSWRKIDKHPRGVSLVLSGMQSLAFVHEAFHWIGLSSYYSMVSFNISNEVYGEIPLPEQVSSSRGNFSFGLSVLDGMLCVHSATIHQQKEICKLWLLKDYDVRESWTPLVTIDHPWVLQVIPLYRFADGEVLFWCLHVQSVRNEFRTSSGPFALWPQAALQNGIAFTESLISPKSLTY